jgi:hypothetical protein
MVLVDLYERSLVLERRRLQKQHLKRKRQCSDELTSLYLVAWDSSFSKPEVVAEVQMYYHKGHDRGILVSSNRSCHVSFDHSTPSASLCALD